MGTKYIIPVILFLTINGLVACQKNSASESVGSQGFDWGQFSWSIGENSYNQVAVKLKSITNNNKHQILVNMKVTTNGLCQEYHEVIDENTLVVKDSFNHMLTIIRPTTTPNPCKSEEKNNIVVTNKEITDVYSGNHVDLAKYQRYVIDKEQLVRVPEVPLMANLGTRSLLVMNKSKIDSYTYPAGALIDIENKTLTGFYIENRLISDVRTEQFFQSQEEASIYELRTIQVDEKDNVYKKQNCRLWVNYVHPLTKLMNENQKNKITTTFEDDDQILRNALSNINIPTEDCP